MAHDPGHGRGVAGSMRGDLDDALRRAAALDARMTRLEAEIAANADAQSATSTELAEPIRILAQDLKLLRNGVRDQLQAADERLLELRRRIDEAAAGPAAAGASDGLAGPGEEERWATLSRDPDPGVRFSSLSRLGKSRTERSVSASVERLADDNVKVVWQALRNLGHFRERDVAAQIAECLDHAEAVIRLAAYDALIAMGAPTDTGFEPTELRERRAAPVEALKRWAEP